MQNPNVTQALPVCLCFVTTDTAIAKLPLQKQYTEPHFAASRPTMPRSRKKVIVRTLEGILFTGYLPFTDILVNGQIELLDLDGRILPVALETILWIAFVRDFNRPDKTDPERLTRRVFLARPRTEGLWLRLTLQGGGLLEGLAPLDCSLLDALIDDLGLFLVPPDIRSNTQRLYIPRSAVDTLQILAVISNASKSKPASRPIAHTPQPFLFPDPESDLPSR